MKLSTRTRYGARALVELALIYPDAVISVNEVAAKQKISAKYLEQIMRILKAADLVKSVRGMHGGYALTRPPTKVTLGEIFEALEGSAAPVDCVDHPGSCAMIDVCPTRDTWVAMKACIEGFLTKTTLQCLAETKTRKADSTTLMYYI